MNSVMEGRTTAGLITNVVSALPEPDTAVTTTVTELVTLLVVTVKLPSVAPATTV
jgi:hypothetical protein